MCFLFVDGHNSHCTLPFLDFEAKHNIEIVSYPSHCKQALQGLDITVFGALKFYWAQECERWERENRLKVGKEHFLQVYHQATLCTYQKEIIQSAFRTTGVFSFKRGAVQPSQMEPTQETYVVGSFLVSMPTPVRRVMEKYCTATPATSPHLPLNDMDIDGEEMAPTGVPEATPIASSPSTNHRNSSSPLTTQPARVISMLVDPLSFVQWPQSSETLPYPLPNQDTSLSSQSSRNFSCPTG